MALVCERECVCLPVSVRRAFCGLDGELDGEPGLLCALKRHDINSTSRYRNDSGGNGAGRRHWRFAEEERAQQERRTAPAEKCRLPGATIGPKARYASGGARFAASRPNRIAQARRQPAATRCARTACAPTNTQARPKCAFRAQRASAASKSASAQAAAVCLRVCVATGSRKNERRRDEKMSRGSGREMAREK